MTGLSDSNTINKVLDDATMALESLYRSLSTGYDEVDYIPSSTSKRAQDELEIVQQIIKQDPHAISDYPRKGIFRDVVNKIGPRLDSPSVQTALGSSAVELMGIFKVIQRVFYEESQYKRVSRKDSDPLGNK
jgi:hypothetical protein